MYIDADTIIKLASLLSAIVALGGLVFTCYKQVIINKQQVEINRRQNEELTIICYGLRGALEGLIEHGCDGPCKDALNLLDKHLNKSAHKPDSFNNSKGD